MGRDLQFESNDIFEAYLVLGILENNIHHSVSTSKIKEKLHGIAPDINVPSVIDKIKYWFIQHSLRPIEIEEIISATPTGYCLHRPIPVIQYRDFVGTFLILNLIRDQQSNLNVDVLVNRPQQNILSILTKFALAKHNNDIVKIEQIDDNFEFQPIRINFKNNDWSISGIKDPHSHPIEKTFQLSEILNIE